MRTNPSQLAKAAEKEDAAAARQRGADRQPADLGAAAPLSDDPGGISLVGLPERPGGPAGCVGCSDAKYAHANYRRACWLF